MTAEPPERLPDESQQISPELTPGQVGVKKYFAKNDAFDRSMKNWSDGYAIVGAILSGTLLFSLVGFILGVIALFNGTRRRLLAHLAIWIFVAYIVLGIVAVHFVFPYFKGQARKASCQSNLQEIGKAILAYKDKNDGVWPDNLETLLRQKYLSAKCFTSPSSGRITPEIPESAPADEIEPFADWCDYIYLRPQGTPPPNQMIAYERLENYDNKETFVLFADGTVKFVTIDEFQLLDRAKPTSGPSGQ